MGPSMPPVPGQLGYFNENAVPGSVPASSPHAPSLAGELRSVQTRMSDAQTNSTTAVPASSAEAGALRKDIVRSPEHLLIELTAVYPVNSVGM